MAEGGRQVEEEAFLTRKDAERVFVQLLLAKDRSYSLGLSLKLPRDVVEEIHESEKDPAVRLRRIVEEALERESSTTWRDIIDALRNPRVNLMTEASRLEIKFLPDLDSEELDEIDIVTTTALDPDFSQLASQRFDGRANGKNGNLDKVIGELKGKFRRLKFNVKECLERSKAEVVDIADALTSLEDDEDEYNKVFMRRNVERLFCAGDISQLFAVMKSHWDYLDPSLLDILVQEFDLTGVKKDMKSYNSELQKFKEKTPLAQFYQSQTVRGRKKKISSSRAFRENVTAFKWPKNVMLKDVESFREGYASHYSFLLCALMIQEEL